MVLNGMREAGAKPALINKISDLLDPERLWQRRHDTWASQEAQSLLQELSSSGLSALHLKVGRQLARRKELAEELAVI